MNKIQRVLLVLATIGYLVVIFSFLTQDLWVMLISVIVSTSLLVAFNLFGTNREEVMMVSLELQEAYNQLDTVKAENEELKASVAKKDEDIKEAEKLIEDTKAEVEKARVEAEEAFKNSENLKKQIEEAKADIDKVREDEQMRSLLPSAAPGESEVNIVEVTSEIMDEFDSFASKMDIVIRMISIKNNVPVMADKHRLRIMLRNIMDNSLKYMNKAGVLVVTISDVEDYVFIVCKDDGMGLSEAETEHVFELNFQGSNRISGNGLGLAQAKAIVDFYNGDIYAKSSEGGGMAIYIKLPKMTAEKKIEPVMAKTEEEVIEESSENDKAEELDVIAETADATEEIEVEENANEEPATGGDDNEA